MESENHIIVVAGGKGLRMGADLPKQFLPIGGKPVLMHTMERFHEYDPQMEIILVLPREQQAHWHRLCRDHAFAVGHRIVDGGASRFQSSWNGLRALPPDARGLVGIHDGVRPFPSTDTIRRCYEAASRTGAAIPALPLVDSLRHIEPQGHSTAVDRADYRIVQTPQVFSIPLLKAAYEEALRQAGPADPSTLPFTDDASVVEAYGHPVTLVCGNPENIKLTTPFDLTLAEALLNPAWKNQKIDL